VLDEGVPARRSAGYFLPAVLQPCVAHFRSRSETWQHTSRGQILIGAPDSYLKERRTDTLIYREM